MSLRLVLARVTLRLTSSTHGTEVDEWGEEEVEENVEVVVVMVVAEECDELEEEAVVECEEV